MFTYVGSKHEDQVPKFSLRFVYHSGSDLTNFTHWILLSVCSSLTPIISSNDTWHFAVPIQFHTSVHSITFTTF